MSDLVTLTIDGVEVGVPKGTYVADAAKMIQNDIPVFCHHPKLKPVGMCRMCLVEIGLPMRDRATGELLKNEDGSTKVSFRGLQTACTQEVSEGMVVRTGTKPVTEARETMIEFLLTSHPLDCPICDKGGECPLQNLTMAHGKGTTRVSFSDKIKLDKHVPLGELIYLDRERCIQCARCIRFQDEIVDDPVIHFHNRGRKTEIVTMSNPGFDSYWSGNTTDICPVGALTTADFRFGARPWELTPVASICPHCPVGCNTTMSTRREALSGGRSVIKRIMPRQNESVNEIWICDKGRFVHHFADAPERLKKPLIRKEGELVEASWDEALDTVAGKLQQFSSAVAGLANDRLSNEDLFLFQKLFRQGLKSNNIDLVNRRMGGSDVVAQVGISSGSNLKELGAGDAVVVVASDLHEEAPVWWMRLKQATERGASLVILNVRPTRLDKFATQVLRYKPGEAISLVRELVSLAHIETESSNGNLVAAAADTLVRSENLIAFYGCEGLTCEQTEVLAKLLGNLLQIKNGKSHVGHKNNGLIPVWPHNNTQGAFDMGLHPYFAPGYIPVEEPGLDAAAIYAGAANGVVNALFLVGADPIGDGLMDGRGRLDFLVVQDLFLTETAALADVVLPAQSWVEREGTFTTGERRVQRYYQAIPGIGESRPDWQILSQIGERIGLGKSAFAASLIFREIAQSVSQYKDIDYRSLAKTEKQWPDVGGEDLYYGGNAYNNLSGLGQQWMVKAESDSESVEHFTIPEQAMETFDRLPLIAKTALYTPGTLINHSAVINSRIAHPILSLHKADAEDLRLVERDKVNLMVDGRQVQATIKLASNSVEGVALLSGIKTRSGATIAESNKLEEKEKEIA